MVHILIVDDEAAQRAILADILEAKGYSVSQAGSTEEAEKVILTTPPQVVITDLKMPREGGLQLVGKIRAKEIPPEILVLTAYGSSETAIKAMQLGAYDYLTKPVNPEELLVVIRRASEKYNLRLESLRLKNEVGRQFGKILIAKSKQMTEILELISRVAQSDATVLIRGESGTGKEGVARLLHLQSPRSLQPMLSLNCAAFPETLLESELFGFEKGAFSGATQAKPGLIEAASGGTLFLDEIGDMPLSLQSKLLRVLQEKEVRRLGSNQTKKVNIRILAATNKNLEESIQTGSFREDLYYRLNVIPIHLPPLRERIEDIPVLANFFLGRHSSVKSFSESAMKTLLSYSWPGNVRQLETLVERVTILTMGPVIDYKDLPKEVQSNLTSTPTLPLFYEFPQEGISFEEVERGLIEKAIRQAGGNMTEAAKFLSMSYRAFRYRAQKFGIVER